LKRRRSHEIDGLPPGEREPAINADVTFSDAALAELAKSRDPKWEELTGEDRRISTFRQHFVLSPLPIKEQGYIRVRLKYGDFLIRAGALTIICQSAPQVTGQREP
jgi:hypothetical protein